MLNISFNLHPDDFCFSIVTSKKPRWKKFYIKVPFRYLKRKYFSDIYFICHELGHYKNYKDLSKSGKKNRNKAGTIYVKNRYLNCTFLDEEIKAWLYVFDCIKPEKHNMICKRARIYIRMYLKRFEHARSNKYWINKLDRILEWRMSVV